MFNPAPLNCGRAALMLCYASAVAGGGVARMSAARCEPPGCRSAHPGLRVGGSKLKFSLVLASRKYMVQTAVLACLLATLALSACGRKGGLDAPPGASVLNQAPQSVPEV